MSYRRLFFFRRVGVACCVHHVTSKLENSWELMSQYHLQQAPNVFYMDRWILQNRNVSIVNRFSTLFSVVSSMACFACGHGTICNRHLERLESCADQLSALRLVRIGRSNGTKYFINGIFGWAYSGQGLNHGRAKYSHTTATRLGSTYYAMVPHWHISNWSPKIHFCHKDLIRFARAPCERARHWRANLT